MVKKTIKPPAMDDIETIARAELARIPSKFRRLIKNVAIRVEEFPDAKTEDELGLDSPFDLLGLYTGVSLDQKSSFAAQDSIDMITLYRRPILDFWCETGEDLNQVVRHVLIHEIGHHFGFNDEEMERIENQA